MNRGGMFYAISTLGNGVSASGYYSSESIHTLLSQNAMLTHCEDRDKWRIVSLLLNKHKQKQSQGKLILKHFCLDNACLSDWFKDTCFSSGRMLAAEHNVTNTGVLLQNLGDLHVTSSGKGWRKKIISWISTSIIPDNLTESVSVVRCQGAVSEGDHLLFEDSFVKARSSLIGEEAIPPPAIECIAGVCSMLLKPTTASVQPQYALFSKSCDEYIDPTASTTTLRRGATQSGVAIPGNFATTCCSECFELWRVFRSKRKKLLNIQKLIQSPQSAELMSSCPILGIITDSGAEMLTSPLSDAQLTNLPTSLKNELLVNLYRLHNSIRPDVENNTKRKAASSSPTKDDSSPGGSGGDGDSAFFFPLNYFHSSFFLLSFFFFPSAFLLQFSSVAAVAAVAAAVAVTEELDSFPQNPE